MIALWKRVPESKEWLRERTSEIVNPVFEQKRKELAELSSLHPEKSDIIKKLQEKLHELRENKVEEFINEVWLKTIPSDTPQSIDTLIQMTWRFVISEKKQYFITSDNPIFFFPLMDIGNGKSEVTFPITKNIALWATRRKDIREGYFPAHSQMVKEVNRRTVNNSTQFLYSPYPEDWIRILANKAKIKLNSIV